MLSRYTQPEAEHRMLLQRLRLKLPEQPPPKITASQVATTRHRAAPCSEDLRPRANQIKHLAVAVGAQLRKTG